MVVITATDARTATTSFQFVDMLEASLRLRGIEFNTLIPSTPIVDYNTSEALNSEYLKQLDNIGKESDFHIDIRTYNFEYGSPTASLDFIVAQAIEVTDQGTNDALVGMLNNFSDTEEKTIRYESMFCSIYCALVLKLPTVCVIINEASFDLYRAAADELAEFVEQFFPRKML